MCVLHTPSPQPWAGMSFGAFGRVPNHKTRGGLKNLAYSISVPAERIPLVLTTPEAGFSSDACVRYVQARVYNRMAEVPHLLQHRQKREDPLDFMRDGVLPFHHLAH